MFIYTRGGQIKIRVTVFGGFCCKDDKDGPTKVFKGTVANNCVKSEVSVPVEWLKDSQVEATVDRSRVSVCC
ncbi:hypothetical protein RJT34_23240 [Clitoria ternatea]|uniref:Uncharacterized protein n=1 Tax=Clitoria ternatea TaxID=43366 RepID=A0AAN9II84_CLITE